MARFAPGRIARARRPADRADRGRACANPMPHFWGRGLGSGWGEGAGRGLGSSPGAGRAEGKKNGETRVGAGPFKAAGTQTAKGRRCGETAARAQKKTEAPLKAILGGLLGPVGPIAAKPRPLRPFAVCRCASAVKKALGRQCLLSSRLRAIRAIPCSPSLVCRNDDSLTL